MLASSKIYYRNNIEKIKKQKIIKRNELKKLNKCVNCSKDLLANEKYRCLSCREKHNSFGKKAFNLLAEKGLCRGCQQPLDGSGNKYFCKKCNLRTQLRRNKHIQNTKRRCIEFLGGKCSVCGLKTEFISVYDFHHKNPDEKEKGVRNLLGCVWEKIEKELIKCILVCANCHRIIHFERDNQ
jgi:hypothetical protein